MRGLLKFAYSINKSKGKVVKTSTISNRFSEHKVHCKGKRDHCERWWCTTMLTGQILSLSYICLLCYILNISQEHELLYSQAQNTELNHNKASNKVNIVCCV